MCFCVCAVCVLLSVSAAHAFISHTLRIRHVIVDHADNLMPAICENKIPTHYHTHKHTQAPTQWKHTLCLNIFPFINFPLYTCTYNLQQPLATSWTICRRCSQSPFVWTMCRGSAETRRECELIETKLAVALQHSRD